MVALGNCFFSLYAELGDGRLHSEVVEREGCWCSDGTIAKLFAVYAARQLQLLHIPFHCRENAALMLNWEASSHNSLLRECRWCGVVFHVPSLQT